MNFSMNVICKPEAAGEKLSVINELLSALGIEASPAFEPYWKERALSQLSYGGSIGKPDFPLIETKLREIAKADVSLAASMDAWEFTFYASAEELLTGERSAFIECNIY